MQWISDSNHSARRHLPAARNRLRLRLRLCLCLQWRWSSCCYENLICLKKLCVLVNLENLITMKLSFCHTLFCQHVVWICAGWRRLAMKYWNAKGDAAVQTEMLPEGLWRFQWENGSWDYNRQRCINRTCSDSCQCLFDTMEWWN